MKSIVKQSGTVLLLYYIGRLITFLSTAYLFPLVLGTSALGLYSGIKAIGFLISRFDLSSAIIRFFVRLKGDKQKKAAFFTGILFATTLLYLLVLIPFFVGKKLLIQFFSQNAAEIITYLPISMVLGYLIVLNITIKAWYIALKHIIWPNFLQHISLPLLINLNVLAYYKGLLSFHQMLIGLIVPYALNVSFLIVYLAYIGELAFHWDIRCFDRNFVRSFVMYSFFMIMGTNLILILARIDTIMILGLCSKQEAGIYRTVVFVALLLNTPVKALNQATFSTIAHMLATKTYDRLDALYKKITLYQSFFSCLLCSLLYAGLPYVFYALPAETLKVATRVFILLALGELIYNLFNVSHVILIFSQYFKLNLFTFLLLLLGVLANYLMIGAWGMVGAAGATFLALLAAGICTCWLVWYKLHMHPFSRQLAIVIGMTILNLMLQNLLPVTWQLAFNTSLRVLIVFISYSLLALGKIK